MIEDEEGYWTRNVSFEPSGAIYSLRCPGCGRWLSAETFDVRQNWLTECVEGRACCGKCGEIEPVHLGWTGDYA